MQFGGNPSGYQSACVLDVLVAQDVEIADIEVGLRKAGKIGRSRGRRVRGHVVRARRTEQRAQPV